MSELAQYLPSPQMAGVIIGAVAVAILLGFFIAPERTARAFAFFFLFVRSAVRLYRHVRGRPEPSRVREAPGRGVKAPKNALGGTISDFLHPRRPVARRGEERDDA